MNMTGREHCSYSIRNAITARCVHGARGDMPHLGREAEHAELPCDDCREAAGAEKLPRHLRYSTCRRLSLGLG